MLRFLWQYPWYSNIRYYLKPATRFAVIIAIPSKGDGNQCDHLATKECIRSIYFPDGTSWWQEDGESCPINAVHVHVPVFSLGEVLLVDRSGRERYGQGRKPDKWYVECEYFWFRFQAERRAKSAIEENKQLERLSDVREKALNI